MSPCQGTQMTLVGAASAVMDDNRAARKTMRINNAFAERMRGMVISPLIQWALSGREPLGKQISTKDMTFREAAST